MGCMADEPSRIGGRSTRRGLTASLGIGTLLMAGCYGEPTPSEPVTPTVDAELRQSLQRWGVVPIGEMPEQAPRLVSLGRALFFDPVLSGNRDISCATCHHPSFALGDGRSLPAGTRGTGLGPTRSTGPDREPVPRSAPSLLNSGLGMPYLLWDGRVSWGRFTSVAEELSVPLPGELSTNLAAQTLLPLLDRREMRGDPGDRDVFGAPNELAELDDTQHGDIWNAVVRRLVAIPGYVELFRSAFPDTPASSLRITHVARALATFQMEAFTKTRSPFDRYLDRVDQALTSEQKRGALLFFGDARCGSCHGGPFLGAQGFANVGVPQIGPGVGSDAPLDGGRGTLIENDFYRFAFRVAPLRNVELTGPYMHNGAFATLEAVVRHYDDVPVSIREYDPATHLDPSLQGMYHGDEATIEAVLSTLDHRLRTPLELSERDISDLVAFLKSLTDPSARELEHIAPGTVPSGLPVAR